MNLRIVRAILRKELLDTMRDKRTLIMMVGVPVLLYPALMIIGLQLAIVNHNQLQSRVSSVALSDETSTEIVGWLRDADGIDVQVSSDPESALASGAVDVVLVGPASLDTEKQTNFEIRYDSTAFASLDAAGRVEGVLRDQAQDLLSIRLRDLGVDQTHIEPFEIARQDVAPPAKATGNIIGLILPMLMVIMVALGAFYPAVDLTAGEKERGTFETLLSTPAKKLEIVTGKFLAVFAMAMATGLLNLGSMAATFAFMIAQVTPMLDEVVSLEFEFPIQAFLIVLAILVPLGFLVSALMMSVAVFAKSFKEAQNYVTPFFLVLTLPVMLSSMPGLELEGATRFVPLLNIILLFKGLMIGKATLDAAFAVFLSTAAFALLALLFAAWLFQREEVILSEERGVPLTFRRSEFQPRATPTPTMALLLFGGVMVLIFYVGSLVQQRAIMPGLLITEWLLILLPVLALLLFVKIDLRSALSLYWPGGLGLLGAVIAGAGAVVLMIQVGSWHNKVLPIPEDMEAQFENLFAPGGTPPGLALLLFAVAFSPAICEEVLFRGAILSGLRDRLAPWAVILAVGILFGLFHISLYRILPTGILGVFLTYVVLRSGSILPGMAVHFIVNATSILIATENMPAWVGDKIDVESIEASGLPWDVLAVAGVVFAVGIALVEVNARQRKRLPS